MTTTVERFGRLRPRIVHGFDRVFPRVVEGAGPSRLYSVLTHLPDRVLQILLSLFVAAYLMAELSLYKPYTVLPLAAVFVVLTWRLIPADVVPSRGHAIASAAAILLALVWVVVQLPFETEFVVASRDPGIYSNLGAALARTGTSTIDLSKAVADAAGIPNATANLGGFHYLPTKVVQLQGGNALPSMLGLGYWVGGVNGLTIVNSVLGGVALIGVFSLARRVLGAAWGLLPAVVLGLSMPMVYFARAPYTEVISLAVFVGALIWFWSALSTGRVREFVMAGLFAGAACMTRIDALLGVAALVAAFALILAGVGRPRGSFDLRRSYVAYVVPTVLLGLAGAYDQKHNFPSYVSSLGSESKSLWALAIAAVVVGFVVIGVRTVVARVARGRVEYAGVTGGLGRPLGDRPARVLGIVLAVIVPVVFLYWAVRPRFLAYHYNTTPSAQAFVQSLQNNTGLPLDGSRSYDEYSLYWFVWYFGVPFVFAVVIGLSALVYRSVRSRRPGLMVFAILTLGVALLYLNKISIAPDQMWAFRRVLPIVAPGFIVGAFYLVKWLGSHRNRLAIGAAGAIAALIVGSTIGAWNPRLFVTTEYSNQATMLRSICDHIGTAKSVVLVERDENAWALSLKNFCGVDTISVATNTVDGQSPATTAGQLRSTQASLKSLEGRLGAGTPVVVFDRTLLNWEGTPPDDIYSSVIDVWERTLLSAPNSYTVSTTTAWMGTLQPSGLVKGEQ